MVPYILWLLFERYPRLDRFRMQARFYLFVMFLSGMAEAFILSFVATAHGWVAGHPVCFSWAVGLVGFLWEISTIWAIFVLGGRPIDIILLSETLRVEKNALPKWMPEWLADLLNTVSGTSITNTILHLIMGFIVVETTVIEFFLFFPLPPHALFGLLILILGWYTVAKKMGKVFNWAWFYWPLAIGTLGIALEAILKLYGFYSVSETGYNRMPHEFGPWVLQQIDYRLGWILVGIALMIMITSAIRYRKPKAQLNVPAPEFKRPGMGLAWTLLGIGAFMLLMLPTSWQQKTNLSRIDPEKVESWVGEKLDKLGKKAEAVNEKYATAPAQSAPAKTRPAPVTGKTSVVELRPPGEITYTSVRYREGNRITFRQIGNVAPYEVLGSQGATTITNSEFVGYGQGPTDENTRLWIRATENGQKLAITVG